MRRAEVAMNEELKKELHLRIKGELAAWLKWMEREIGWRPEDLVESILWRFYEVWLSARRSPPASA